MGFLSFLRKREKKQATEIELPSIEIKLSGLSAWLGQELSGKTSSARSRSEELQDRIIKGFSQVRASAEKLGRAEFEVKDKTYAAVNSVKDTFANRTRSLAGKCPDPALDRYSGMTEFRKRAGDLLRELMNISPRQGVALSNYFKKEGSSVMKNIKSLNSLLEEFQRFLDYEGKSLFILEGAEKISSEISGKLENLRGLEKRENEIRKEIRGLKENLSGKEKNLDVISKDPGWEALKKVKKEREALEKRAGDLKFRIGEELSSAKRPLKKYLHLKAGELNREERDFLERFVKSPLKTFMGGSGGRLRPFLLSLREILDREISLKDKEVEKLDSLIKRLESGEISKMMEEYSGLLREAGERAGEIEKDFSSLSEDKRQAEDSVKESKEGTGKLEKELEEAGKKTRSLKEDMGKDREKLETLIYENINRKVSIDLGKDGL
ncbi:MAG: hypothetical protein KAT35_06100, partial [Candidatus Aenigmarchaeota archaeon]|nr:hypothetical protein [Candidatus Aenigmarchaeota archaeon]